MGSFLNQLVFIFGAAILVTAALVVTARYGWRRGKSLEEP